MTPILPSIDRMQPGDHYCGFFRTDEDHRAVIVDFIRGGLARHEKIFYLVNITTADQLRATLMDAGIEVDALLESGQLAIVSARDTYLSDGQFVPERMIARLSEETDKALAEGYSALRATGEMTWALAGEPGSERLVEYESELAEFFATHSHCTALCQYDRRRFDAEMLLDILHVHPNVLYGRDGFDNKQMYYVADSFRERDRSSATLDTWLRNLTVKGAPSP